LKQIIPEQERKLADWKAELASLLEKESGGA
jgi:hypothetical protein